MAYKVFISYSTKDIPNVDALRTFLQFPDVECFVSEYAVVPGAPIAATTKAAILTCDLFVLLWSKNAQASEWVSRQPSDYRRARRAVSASGKASPRSAYQDEFDEMVNEWMSEKREE